MLHKILNSKYILFLTAFMMAAFLFSFILPSGRFASASTPAVGQPLSFVERVDCRTSIEQVYWDATEWPTVNPGPKPSLSSVLSQSEIESNVENTLAQSVALQQKWGLMITADMLQSEMTRMADYSQSPDRLQDLFSALGNNPAVIAECLVRPALVERLVRQQYNADVTIHAGAKAQAEAALGDLTTAEQLAALPNAQTVTWILAADEMELRSEKTAEGAVALEEAAFSARMEEARGAFNLAPDVALPLDQVSPLNENDGRFYAMAVKEVTGDRLQVVYATWEKQPFEDWWSANKAAFDKADFAQPINSYSLPSISSKGDAFNGSDSWQYMPAMPWVTTSGQSVWTGSVMIVWGAYTTNGFRYDPVLDDWRPITTLNAAYARHSFTAVWTGTEMIVYGGCNGGTEFCTDGSGGRYNPATDTWASMALGTARRQHTAVWSGTEMLVWGGCIEDPNGNQNCNTLVTQGGRYNPVTDSWSNMTLSGAPTGTRNPVSVWANNQMIIWNGTSGINARYFPDTDSWQSISTTNAPPGLLPTLIWTGGEMIAWGGCSGAAGCPTVHNEGGRYDPATDTWTPTTLTNAPAARKTHSAVWTGSEMFIWGGYVGGGTFLSDGGRYNPMTDTWTPISNTGAPSPRGSQYAHWTGQVMIIWGGTGFGDERTGGRYNPATDSWMPTTTNDPKRLAVYHASIWDGAHMISWGGEGESFLDPYYQHPRLYDPATDTWGMGTQNPDLPYLWWPTAVWSGTEMIIWGGQYGSNIFSLGARYNPMTDSWTQTTLINAPEERGNHTAVWTGSKMVVWGGSTQTELAVNTGGVYDPVTDSWTETTLTDAPIASNLHEAVWTGSEMIVWGGRDNNSISTNTGGKYDPVTDSWATMTTTNAPSGRVFYAYTWTGSEFLVWGGGSYFSNWTYFQDGGLYDPATDSWTPTNMTNAPEGRARLASIWTGEELVVWGGCNDHNCLEDIHTGGRYNPATGVWLATTTDHVIEGRDFHTMVWTGSEILVWGGQTERNGYSHIGGRYLFPFSGNTAPQANADNYSLQENTTLTVTAPGVLTNDFDVNNDPLTATLVTTPTSGSLIFNPDGSFVYTPETGFSGIVTFHYRAFDGIAQSNIAPVTLDVMPEPNQAPVATGDGYTTTMNVALTVPAPGVLGNDSDPNGDPLQAVMATGPTNGLLTLNSDGGFTYTPNTDFSGQDSFTYQAYDGMDYSDPVVVTITVEFVPPEENFTIFMPVVLKP